MIEALDIRVRGIVQGVGFRPFVYRLARRYLVNGWVLNDLDGVFIHAEAETKLLDEFVTELHMNPPAAARVREVELKEVPLQDCTRFEIRESVVAEPEEATLVSADLAMCDDCARELHDPADRRYRYPFINCTNCGPRFTIIDELPYDRPATSMAPFDMCPDCAREYEDPADRRFHAQPDACFACGPQLMWTDLTQGEPETLRVSSREESDDLLARAVELLVDGGVVAVKGLGGFHLVCDASNADALARLRAAKHRDGKAFAVMVPDVAAARAWCMVGRAEEELLSSPARPIVLLRKHPQAELAPGLADKLPELGVMLPTTPLQCLLVEDFRAASGRDMLVMTSGNVHDEPIVIDDDEAIARFRGMADAVLGNDRQILTRFDDSVARIIRIEAVSGGNVEEAVQFIRRARGYAPLPLALKDVAGGSGDPAGEPSAPPAVFAAGPEQKSTFAFLQDGQAFVSQHIGDLEDADVSDAWFAAKERFEKLFGCVPHALACDAHPEYLSSKWARGKALGEGMPLTEVQHHHAHVASVLGEHDLFGPCCGIAFDGTGYGADGAIWGGEVLVANQADYERFANFAYVPMPGGAAAVKHPLRMAYGFLWACDLLDHAGAAPALEALGQQADICAQMIESGLNTPHTSSVGRLFDAVSALLGLCIEPTYEGEAAVLLDAARDDGDAEAARADWLDVRERYAVAVKKNAALDTSTAHDTSVVLFDAEPTLRAVLDDLAAGVPVGIISRRFHDAVVDAVVQAAQLVYAVYDIRLVALSGGVFMNRYLVEHVCAQLGAAGFTVALNGDLPPNDGCISFGQAVVAAASR